MAYEYLNALAAKIRGALALGNIRARYLKPCVMQDLRKRSHGNSADAYKVTFAALFKKLIKIRHIISNQCVFAASFIYKFLLMYLFANDIIIPESKLYK